jgi:hypothetical protein
MCKLCARKRINDSASKIFFLDRHVGNGAHNRNASAGSGEFEILSFAPGADISGNFAHNFCAS